MLDGQWQTALQYLGKGLLEIDSRMHVVEMCLFRL
jgi:hypothetical protein